MKRIRYTDVMKGIAALLVFSSCVKLKETPPGALAPEQFYQTQAEFDAAITGCYEPLFTNYTAFDFYSPVLIGAGAEDVTTRPELTAGAQIDVLKPTADNTILNSCWVMLYKSIANCNGVIGNIGNIQSLGTTTVDGYDGQAKFLRAMDYFYLTRWFGEIPLLTEKNQATASTVGQDSVATIYAQIVSDLQDAESELPTAFSGEPGRATSGAASGLLAKVYLTMAGWPLLDASKYPLAEAEAAKVINAGTYSLEPVFSDLWLADNKFTNPEFMFILSGLGTVDGPSGSHDHVSTRPGNEGGWSDWFTEARFYNEFPAGPRKDASFHTVFEDGTLWQNSTYAQPYISKYRDAGAAAGFTGPIFNDNGDGFFPVLRYADVLLIYAEAANMSEGGASATALNDLNMVRRRAQGVDPNTPNPLYDLPSGMSMATFDDSVIAERNWELAFEGNRWFDLVRKQMVVQVNQALYPYVDAHNMLLPKPTIEIGLLNGLLKQNTGY